MNKSEELKHIDCLDLLASDHRRQSGQDIEYEESCEVGASDAWQVSVFVWGVEKAEHDLYTPWDIIQPNEPL